MAFTRPTLTTLDDRKRSDLESSITGADARLRRNVLFAMAKASSAEAHGIYGYLNFLAEQIVPDLASTSYLTRFSDWWGVPRKAAIKAAGNVDFTGTDGSTVTAGSIVQDSSSVQYTVDSNVVIASGVALVAVTAVVGGTAGNQASGVSLTLTTPLTGVNSVGTVASTGLVSGADIETDSELQIRLRDFVQTPPHGGNINDYVTWAKEVAGVTRAFAFSNYSGNGTVGLFFVRDDDVSFIPDSGEIATVQAYIDARRPAGMSGFSAFAPTEVVQPITVSISPNTSGVQAAITAELTDLFLREGDVDDGAGSGTILISQIREAVSIAAGEVDNSVTVPAANVTVTVGQILSLGTITFNTL